MIACLKSGQQARQGDNLASSNSHGVSAASFSFHWQQRRGGRERQRHFEHCHIYMGSVPPLLFVLCVIFPFMLLHHRCNPHTLTHNVCSKHSKQTSICSKHSKIICSDLNVEIKNNDLRFQNEMKKGKRAGRSSRIWPHKNRIIMLHLTFRTKNKQQRHEKQNANVSRSQSTNESTMFVAYDQTAATTDTDNKNSNDWTLTL